MKNILLLSALATFIFLSVSVASAQEGRQISLSDALHNLPEGSKLTLKKELIINKGTDKVLLGHYCPKCMHNSVLCQDKKHPKLTFILVVANVDNTKHRKKKKGMVLTVDKYVRPQLKVKESKVKYIQITNKNAVDLQIKHLTNIFDVKIETIETEEF